MRIDKSDNPEIVCAKKAAREYWYAVMKDNDDDDWGCGSYSLSEAEAKVAAYKEQGYAAAYIAVIDEGSADDPADPICIDEIR